MPRIKESLQQVRERVVINDTIGRVDHLRDAVIETGTIGEVLERNNTSYEQLTIAAKRRNLLPFKDFLAGVSVRYQEGYRMNGIFDRTPNAADDPYKGVLEALFMPENRFLRRKWSKLVDAHVTSESDKALDEIDQAEAQGKILKRKGLAIVGGGLASGIPAEMFAPFTDVTVITDKPRLLAEWEKRPIYLNSSIEKEDIEALGVRNDSPSLPLLRKNTTPLTAYDDGLFVESTVLLNADTKTVVCDPDETGRRETRRYPSGLDIADLGKTNLVAAAGNFRVEQTVRPERTVVTDTGARLTYLGQDGKQRQEEFDRVLFLTGPGEEVCKFTDPASREDYENARTQLQAGIADFTLRSAGLRETLRNLKELKQSRVTDAQIEVTRRRIKALLPKIPHIMTLTGLGELHALWVNELDSDPVVYPLEDFVSEGKATGYAGAKDTPRTVREHQNWEGPVDAYPAGMKGRKKNKGLGVFYNERQRISTYDSDKRARYREVLGSSDKTIPYKVDTCRNIYDRQGNEIGVVFGYADANDREYEDYFDYGVVGTGLQKSKVPEQLRFAVGKLGVYVDLDGEPALQADRSSKVFIGGAAADLTVPVEPLQGGRGRTDISRTIPTGLPEGLRNILSALDVSENSLAEWLNRILIVRGMLSVLKDLPIDETHIKKLVAFDK